MIIFHVFRKQNSCPPPLLDLSPYIRISLLPSPLLDRRRDEKRVTVSPLESAFTNRDTCNPFRIRFYKNCRVSPRLTCHFFLSRSPIDADQHPVAPFFSCTYELPILQPLCFHIHACNGGVYYPPSSHSGTRAVRASQHPPDQPFKDSPPAL